MITFAGVFVVCLSMLQTYIVTQSVDTQAAAKSTAREAPKYCPYFVCILKTAVINALC